jgi:predicted phosphodiesterase
VIDFSSDAPLLVFGGPYSNLRATEALIAEARRLGIPGDRAICTGDVVAYCAEPEETVTALRAWGCHVIQGNCEEQLATGAADCGCNFAEGTACDLLSKGWYPFALQQVSAENCAWMGAQPRSLTFRYAGVTFRVVHGGNDMINRWVFASQADVIDEELAIAGTDVVVAGHCGIPFLARSEAGVWFNPGVIGMPANDGTPDAWYGLIEATKTGGVKLTTHRLAYDHHGAAAAMRKSGHANGYARTLVTGIWPSFDVLPPAEKAATGVKLKPASLRLSRGRAGRRDVTQPAA